MCQTNKMPLKIDNNVSKILKKLFLSDLLPSEIKIRDLDKPQKMTF